ncbi:MAG: hypothetical protein ACYS7M_07675 [Planctomycetota bacterium]|jgi:hypothetical protein
MMVKRLTILIAVLLVAGCAMWQRLPADATPEEVAAYNAAVAADEAKIRAVGDIAGAAVPGFGWIAPIGAAIVLGVAKMMRTKKPDA